MSKRTPRRSQESESYAEYPLEASGNNLLDTGHLSLDLLNLNYLGEIPFQLNSDGRKKFQRVLRRLNGTLDPLVKKHGIQIHAPIVPTPEDQRLSEVRDIEGRLSSFFSAAAHAACAGLLEFVPDQLELLEYEFKALRHVHSRLMEIAGIYFSFAKAIVDEPKNPKEEENFRSLHESIQAQKDAIARLSAIVSGITGEYGSRAHWKVGEYRKRRAFGGEELRNSSVKEPQSASTVKHRITGQELTVPDQDKGDPSRSRVFRALERLGPDGRLRSEEELRFDRSNNLAEKVEIAVKTGWVNRVLSVIPAGTNRTNSEQSPLPNLNYRSELRRRIKSVLLGIPQASNLDICRALDDDGVGWNGKTFVEIYRAGEEPKARIESMISKVRADMRKNGLLPAR
jgi:hypothetical protein